MTYVFGREATVKLPEPTTWQDGLPAWEADQAYTVEIDPRHKGHVYIENLCGCPDEHHRTNEYPQTARALGLALLAAADYAENGDTE